jgi:hypothetical protein
MCLVLCNLASQRDREVSPRLSGSLRILKWNRTDQESQVLTLLNLINSSYTPNYLTLDWCFHNLGTQCCRTSGTMTNHYCKIFYDRSIYTSSYRQHSPKHLIVLLLQLFDAFKQRFHINYVSSRTFLDSKVPENSLQLTAQWIDSWCITEGFW